MHDDGDSMLRCFRWCTELGEVEETLYQPASVLCIYWNFRWKFLRECCACFQVFDCTWRVGGLCCGRFALEGLTQSINMCRKNLWVFLRDLFEQFMRCGA